ncbi:kinase-like protein [Xylariaceae sp. FL0662B]|nr:kinase-like protein [Xylariaceae sp. FL0662B]
MFPMSGDLYFSPRRMLGQGGFGAVDLVVSRESFKGYARKRVIRGRDSESNRKAQNSIIEELRQLKQLSHRHLVTIIGSYTDKEYIAYLMSPVAHGTLDQFLGQAKTLNLAQREMIRRFYGCLAGAVHYLHHNRIRHRDLTARNILIYNSDVYISDFGSAYSWAQRPASNTRHWNTPVSPDYMAPEVARHDEKGSASDMWSLGVVFLIMTTRLLGRRLDELQQLVSSHARKNNASPYIHANLPVVTSWLETLRLGNTSSEHDNEPLSWIQVPRRLPRWRICL